MTQGVHTAAFARLADNLRRTLQGRGVLVSATLSHGNTAEQIPVKQNAVLPGGQPGVALSPIPATSTAEGRLASEREAHQAPQP